MATLLSQPILEESARSSADALGAGVDTHELSNSSEFNVALFSGFGTLDSLLVSIEKLRRQMMSSEARVEARAEARFSAFETKHQATY